MDFSVIDNARYVKGMSVKDTGLSASRYSQYKNHPEKADGMGVKAFRMLVRKVGLTAEQIDKAIGE